MKKEIFNRIIDCVSTIVRPYNVNCCNVAFGISALNVITLTLGWFNMYPKPLIWVHIFLMCTQNH